MSVSRLFFVVSTIVSIVFAILLPMAQAQTAAPAPAPTSDGEFIAFFSKLTVNLNQYE